MARAITAIVRQARACIKVYVLVSVRHKVFLMAKIHTNEYHHNAINIHQRCTADLVSLSAKRIPSNNARSPPSPVRSYDTIIPVTKASSCQTEPEQLQHPFVWAHDNLRQR